MPGARNAVQTCLGVKAGEHVALVADEASRAVAELTDHGTPAWWRHRLVNRARPLLPGFDPAWVTDARDFYYLADTATGGPLLARLGDATVWAYAACGGISFKFAPLIARVLSQRLAGADPAPTGFRPLDQPCPTPDPVHAQPVHTQPVHTQPVHTQPVHTQPVHTARGLP